MNFKDINVTLRAASAVCALNRNHEMADRLGAIADLFREFLEGATKLAEREKALTVALSELLSDIEGLSNEFSICREIAESSYADKARAALALHKEDA